MRAAALALVALALGCSTESPAPISRGWTLFDLAPLAAMNPQQRVLVGAEGAPEGVTVDNFVAGPGPLVPLNAAFTEGHLSPYVTTNVWQDVPEVWIQPMYIFVTHWDPALRRGMPVMGRPWIYTVGPTSRFHSPFWRVYWVELPDGARAYTSSDQIFADHLVMHEGPGRLVAVVPPGTQLSTLGATSPWFGDLDLTLPAVRTQDYLDGERVGAIDFGENRFEWNDDLEVIEQPLFVFQTCPAGAGRCEPAGVPSIGGTGPLFARRPAIAPGGIPRYGAFWRHYLVTLPNDPNLRLFVPPDEQHQKYLMQIQGAVKGVTIGTLAGMPDEMFLAQASRHFMQVAMNGGTCFKDAASFAGCRWLDSQAALEDNLANNIARTGVTLACPFVGYAAFYEAGK